MEYILRIARDNFTVLTLWATHVAKQNNILPGTSQTSLKTSKQWYKKLYITFHTSMLLFKYFFLLPSYIPHWLVEEGRRQDD